MTDFDKKVIYTDSLNMPGNTSADALSSLLPELVQRPGELVMNNYDIKIDGTSLGSAADVALTNLHIVDVLKVEVSHSAMSSYQNNGQGGSINFVLRSKGDSGKNTWGSVGAALASTVDKSTQLLLGYKTDKLLFKGILLGEVYDTTNGTQSITYDNGKPVKQTSTSQDTNFRTELARLHMQYKISTKDVLTFNVSEMYIYNKAYIEQDFSIDNSVTQRLNSLNLSADIKYQHSTQRNKFAVEMKYNYSPKHNNDDIRDFYNYDNRQKTNTLSGKLEYKNIFLKTTSRNGISKTADITVGSNFNTSLSHEDANIIDHTAVGPTVRHLPKNNTYYISPYMNLSGAFGKLRLKLDTEFQHFRYNIERNNNSHSAISNTLTGKLMAEWHFTEAQNLRFILDRKLKRPSADQLYPNRLYIPKQMSYVEGNPDLLPTMVHEVTLDYIHNYSWSTFNNLIFNVSTSYSNVVDIISSKRVKVTSEPEAAEVSHDYITYVNSGTSKVLSANLMALYSYKVFSLSFAGNMYHKMSGSAGNNKEYTYFNFSVYPYFTLKDGWNGGARFVYFSRINQTNGYTGDSAVSCITVGKSWRKFSVYLLNDVALNKTDKDVTTSGTQRTERRYNLVQSFVGIGMKLMF